MTIEGAIVDLQNLIDNEGIPFWAKPSLQKIMETVEMERERYIEERKTGKWIEKDGWDGDVYYDCSACGESWTTIEGTPWDNDMNYCPHCGAKMEGAEG